MSKSKKMEDTPEDSKKVILRVASNIVHKLTETLLPSDGRELLKAIVERNCLHTDEDGVLGRALNFRKTGSHEKRLLRCIAVGNLGRDATTKLFCDHVDYGRTLSTGDERMS